MEFEEDSAIIERLTLENREATKYDFNTMNLSPDTESMELKIDQSLLNDLDSYPLNVYLEDNLNKKVGVFHTATVTELMRHSMSISQPLLKMPSSLHDQALQIFKNLQSYMGERKSSKPPIKHVMKYIRLTMNAPEELKDEAYCQVLKQITDNPDQEKTIRGWNILSVMASCFAPSVELYKSLLNNFRDIARNNSNPIIVQKANYTAIRLFNTFESRRKLVPCENEIKHIEANKPIFVEINFFSGGATSVAVESYTTVRELKTIIMRKLKLNITRIPYYSLYEICRKPDRIEERYLDESEKVTDILAIWAKETKQFNDTHKGGIDFKFYIRIQLFYPYKPDDIDTVTMHFVQTCHDVTTGKFQLNEDEIVNLAALQLFVNHGTKQPVEIRGVLEKDIKNYIPPQYFKKYKEGWVNKIYDTFTTLTYKTRLEAKNAYLDILKNNPMFESIQLVVTYSKHNSASSNSQKIYNPEHIPKNCIVAIKPKEVLITDENRNELLRFPFTSIASWAVNSDTFVIVIRNGKNDYSKHYFESTQTKLFQILMDCYSSIYCGKGINELFLACESSSKLFDSLPAAKLKEGETVRSMQAFVYKTEY